MTEARLLSLMATYPQRRALARHAQDGSALATLRRLEARGLVRRTDDHYRLTQRGRRELELTRALARLVARTLRTIPAPR